MTFPKDPASQESYLQALEVRLDAAVQNAQPFVLSKAGKEPNQMEWETAWVADGNTLPIPVDKMLYWYDPEAEIVRGIYSVIRDHYAHLYYFSEQIGVDWNTSQEGVSRSSKQFRWELQPGSVDYYWEDNNHIRCKANKYDYETNTETTDRDVRIYMDGTIEEVGAWSDNFDSVSPVGYISPDRTRKISVTTGELYIYDSPSGTPTTVDFRDVTQGDFSATGDAVLPARLATTASGASSGWLNYASMNTTRGFTVGSMELNIDPSDGIVQQYWGCGSIPASVGNADGYELVFDRNTDEIYLYFNTTLLLTVSRTLSASDDHYLWIYDQDNDRISLLSEQVSPPGFIFNYQDVSRTLPGTNIGYGGYKASASGGIHVDDVNIGAIDNIDRMKVIDSDDPEVIVNNFLVFVRYNHDTSSWTLYNYDEPVPDDYVSSPVQDASDEYYESIEPESFSIGILQSMWDYQQSTGFQITEDTLSSFSFRRYPFFQEIDDIVEQGSFYNTSVLMTSPDGSKVAQMGGSFGGVVYIMASTLNGSTGKVYRLNEWTDGKSDVYLIHAVKGDGVSTSFPVDLTALSIPDDYGTLMFKIGNNEDSSPHDILIQFNGDTGANYSNIEVDVNTGAADNLHLADNDTSIQFEISDHRTTETDPGEQEAFLFQWNDDDVYKSFFKPVQYVRAAILAGHGGTWRNTDAITSIAVTNSNASAFDPEFYLEIYAVRTKGRHHREGELNDYNMA